MMQFLSASELPTSHKGMALDKSTSLKAITHVTLDGPTPFELQYSPGIPGTAPGDKRAQMVASVYSAASTHSVGSHGSAGARRVHTSSAEKALPHMNMNMSSPIVQSRG